MSPIIVAKIAREANFKNSFILIFGLETHCVLATWGRIHTYVCITDICTYIHVAKSIIHCEPGNIYTWP